MDLNVWDFLEGKHWSCNRRNMVQYLFGCKIWILPFQSNTKIWLYLDRYKFSGIFWKSKLILCQNPTRLNYISGGHFRRKIPCIVANGIILIVLCDLIKSHLSHNLTLVWQSTQTMEAMHIPTKNLTIKLYFFTNIQIIIHTDQILYLGF